MAKSLPTTRAEASEPRKDEAEEMKYKAKYALEDIERAEAHKSDKSLMKHVKAAAKSKMKALGKIC
jgi:hypothetical protein